MGDKKRSYLNPKFETDVKGKSVAELMASASWNWDLAKRKVKRIINQRAADKEWEKEHPEKKEGILNKNTQSLLDKIDN